MRILWLSHLIPYPPKGGALQRSYNMVRELARYHTVDVLAFNQQNLMAPMFPDMEAALEEAYTALSAYCGKVSFHKLPMDAGRKTRYWMVIKSMFLEPYNIEWLKSESYAAELKVWLQESYDLVHFDTISLIPYLHLINSEIPKVLDHHNIESHMLLRLAKNEANILKKYYFFQEGKRLEKYERDYGELFDLNIVCSNVDKKRLEKIIGDFSRVETVPNGVDVEYFKSTKLNNNDKRLIFVGRLTWYPNVEAVLYIARRLWPQLKKKFPGLQFDIVGANPPAEISNLALKDSAFNVHGFVDDVRGYIDRATLYICPIFDGGGTKLKVLDAMAMEKAIVAHPIAYEGIDVTPGLDAITAASDLEFVERIGELLNDDCKRALIGRRARTLMESKYSYSNIGLFQDELYKSLISCD